MLPFRLGWVSQMCPQLPLVSVHFGQPEDIGEIVSFLCSDDASYITGENIVVSGGMPSRLKVKK